MIIKEQTVIMSNIQREQKTLNVGPGFPISAFRINYKQSS